MLSPTTRSPVSLLKAVVSTIVTGVFPDRASADRAWDSAIDRGYCPADFSVAVSDEIHKKHFVIKRQPDETKGLQGVGVGGAIGSTAGALAVLLALGVSVVLPGLGIVIAGPVAAAFAAAGAGGAIGGFCGGLYGMGIPEKHIKLVEDHVRNHRVVLTLKARSLEEAESIRQDWKEWAVEVLA